MVKPIVLRLLPGEETIFELRIVNHGNPSNISVDTSPHLIKAMRLKRANHFIEREEVVPILARMPDNADRVDGELLVTGESGTCRVPISLVKDAEDFGGEDDGDEEDDESVPFKINDDYEANEDEDEDEVSEEERLGGSEIDHHDATDYQSFGSLPHKRGFSDEVVAADHQENWDYAEHANRKSNRERIRLRSDSASSFDADNVDYGRSYVADKEASHYSEDQDSSSGQDSRYGSTYHGQENTYEDESEDASDEDEESKGGFFGLDFSAEKIVPIVVLVLIIAVLSLTFYTSIIPEFLGALTSSILIVTLIIYGAATLLKA